MVYFDGILQATVNGGTSSTGNNNSMTIGSRNNGAQYFPGRLDEVRIWNEARTVCQIQATMTTEYTILPTNLVAYYNFNQGVSGSSNTGVTSLPDASTNYNGTLAGFALTGGTSNWLASGAGITSTNSSPSVVNGTDTQTSCSPLVWIDGNTYSTNNNTATFLLSGGSVNGCDSLVSLDLTILTPATGIDVQTSCSPLTWIDGNTYSTNNNSATYSYPGAASNGCDSIVMLDFTILTPATGTDVQTSCSPLTWIDGNTYSTDNNTATFTLSGAAANGCDSIVTLDLTISTVDVGTSVNANVITADAVGATYQWLDCDNGYAVIAGETNATYLPSSNGNYAVEVTDQNCTDTSACVAITAIGIDENFLGTTLSIFPNPTDGEITVQFSELQATISAQVYSLEGTIVQQMTFSNTSSVEMALDHPAGIYVLQLANDQGETARIQIVKH